MKQKNIRFHLWVFVIFLVLNAGVFVFVAKEYNNTSKNIDEIQNIYLSPSDGEQATEVLETRKIVLFSVMAGIIIFSLLIMYIIWLEMDHKFKPGEI
jgi:Ni,Fe-hydrogenase I cytochrome b subunit